MELKFKIGDAVYYERPHFTTMNEIDHYTIEISTVEAICVYHRRSGIQVIYALKNSDRTYEEKDLKAVE